MNVFDQVKRPGDGAVWITGASGGIGRALTLELASRGWTVHATARSAEKLEALAVIAGPGRVIPRPADVTDPDAMVRIVAEIEAEGPLALAIFNAGVYLPMRAQEFDAAKARATFDVNLGGVVNALDPAMKAMIARGSGHLAITASVAGVGGINPGFVETEATSVNDFEMPFLMQPEEAARRIADGLARPGFEIAFPRRFAWFLRILNRLPNQLYFKAWRRLTA